MARSTYVSSTNLLSKVYTKNKFEGHKHRNSLDDGHPNAGQLFLSMHDVHPLVMRQRIDANSWQANSARHRWQEPIDRNASATSPAHRAGP